MSIRLQLLTVALTTLVLPWAGCQYARELESALRGSQEKALLASAATIANALSAQPQRVFREAADQSPFSAAAGDLYVYPLAVQPLLDGYREEWDVPAVLTPLPSRTGYRARVQLGATAHFLYLYLEVDATHFDPEPNNPRLGQDRFDRINLTLQAADGAHAAYFFATAAPGPLAAQSLIKGEDGTDQLQSEPRIQAFWLQTSRGINLEARIPLSMVADRIWIEAVDGRGNGRAGFGPENPAGGRLFFAAAGLSQLLATFLSEGTRGTVIDANAFKLGSAGTLADASPRAGAPGGGDPAAGWYRSLIGIDSVRLPTMQSQPDRMSGSSVQAALGGHAGAQWAVSAGTRELLLSAAAPIIIDGRPHGAVVLQQTADQQLALRDHALRRLFDLTFIATAAAATLMFAFATYLSLRIGRLRSAAESAVGNDGKIRLAMPESARGDEIGALSRSFERLLARLNEHTLYLRTLGGKLSHELRTPLTIVRSSLDNLEWEALHSEQQRFVGRAREGTQRLQSILNALGAASRVEESIKQSEQVNYDLRDLVAQSVAAYRDGFPAARIVSQLPDDACFARGAPDLIVQLLDKLIENAVDFCAPGGAITVSLERAQSHYVLQVANDGPLLPPQLLDRLFESLFEQRPGRDDKPHFGLGLYIVRLVAEFHGGSASAANRSDGSGVVFRIALPLI